MTTQSVTFSLTAFKSPQVAEACYFVRVFGIYCHASCLQAITILVQVRKTASPDNNVKMAGFFELPLSDTGVPTGSFYFHNLS